MIPMRNEDHGNWMNESFTPGLVSVIVPTYNRADLLIPTLDSVHRQTHRPIELIVVDDGSTDSTADVVRAWSGSRRQTDFDIRYVTQSHRGACAARNHGLRISRGEFIQYLDSDDRLRPDKLQTQTDVLRAHPDLDYVYSRTVQLGRNGKVNSTIGRPMDTAHPSRDIPRHLWHTSAPLYRRAICRRAGPWDEELYMSQDWDYAARIKAASLKGHFLPDILSEYVMHAAGQIVKRASLEEVESRHRAIHNVIGLLQRAGIMDRAAWDVCARALIANATNAGSLGDAAAMRRHFADARSLGHVSTRAMAWAAYAASFIAPPGSFKWLLDRIRK